jgi:FkbM family methyltransferase
MVQEIKYVIVISLSMLLAPPVCATPASLHYNLVKGVPDILITPHTEQIGQTWRNGMVWDKDLIQKFYSLLPTDDFFVVFDLGAQTGSFSLLAKYFPNSQWYAFEPIQEATVTLTENLSLNKITNVHVNQIAVTDFCGSVILKMPHMNNWGLSTIGSYIGWAPTVTQREVACIDLDSFVAVHNIKKVHFMKIDTEGSELSILRGAKQLILRDHPIILMEYNESHMKQCNVVKHEVDSFLQEMGYSWTLISSEDILCIPN